MTQPTHDQFTLLYEDENSKVLHEFKAVITDDVIEHLVNFLKGCGYTENIIFESMKDLSAAYFDLLSTQEYVMKWDKPKAE